MTTPQSPEPPGIGLGLTTSPSNSLPEFPCLFCEVVAGKREASVVYEDVVSLVFMDLRQIGEGHCLVIPKRHIRDIYSVDAESGGALIAVVSRIATAAKAAFKSNSILIWQSNDPPLQEVLHLHFHVMPRNPNDGLMRIYPGLPAPAGRETLDRQASVLKAALEST